MKALPFPPLSVILNAVSYDPATGIFTRTANSGARGSRSKPGDIVGSPNARGYLVMSINDRMYYCHRIAWYICSGGQQFSHQIDHINNDHSDNRRCNLRPANQTMNSRNQRMRCDNTSGHKGVSWGPDRNKWQGKVTISTSNKVRKYLSKRFDTLEEAVEWVRTTREAYHGEFANHG